MLYPMDSGLIVARWISKKKHDDDSVNILLSEQQMDFVHVSEMKEFALVVLGTKSRRYYFVNLLLSMHGELSFSSPQGPCIIFFTIMSCKPLSTTTSGISVEITSSISLEEILSNNHVSICACGNPHFCLSTEYNQNRTGPKTLSFTMKFISDFIFCWKKRAVTSCIGAGDCPGSKSFRIKSQDGLYVNLLNKSGRP